MANIIVHNGGVVNIGQQIDTYNDYRGCDKKQTQMREDAVDVKEVDLTFFCTDRFSQDIIEKELASIFRLASSKADACRRLRQSEVIGYITLSAFTNEKKAELMNQYQTRFHFTEEDFKKA